MKHTHCGGHLRSTLLLGIAILCTFSASYAQDPDSAFNPRPPRIDPGVAPGAATLNPNQVQVAKVGNYAVVFTVGEGGIPVGGGILVDFPKAWFSNPVPMIKPVQHTDPSAPHYVTAVSSRDGVELNLSIDHQNLDGSFERYRHVMQLTVAGAPLAAGDKVGVVFANTTSPIISGENEVRVAVDATATGRFRLTESGAPYRIYSGPAASVLLVAPSHAVVGKQIQIQLTLFDALYNIVENDSDVFEITGLTDNPIRIPVRGRARVMWTPKKEGYHWPVVTGPFGTSAGPIHVTATEPETKVYWGDIHSHTRVSKDGIGYGDYVYARDATRLDFYAATDHGGDDSYKGGAGPGDSISGTEWARNVDLAKKYYQPGRFATILAYECSLPNGHHNVYFRDLEGMPWPSYRVKSPERLWDMLEEGSAFTVPHHLGIQWGGNDRTVTEPGLQQIETGRTFRGGPRLDWTREHNAALRPSLEMYSEHGQSEYFDREDPLAYEQVRYTAARSADGQHYARDAWAAGHPMGVVAASDNHESHPGLSHYGLTAVFAPELTREAVFDAMRTRQTYGTTGQRILLEFEAAGLTMGNEGQASGAVEGRAVVAAPSEIRFAEVLAFVQGGDEWKTLARWDSPGKLLESEFSLTVESDTTIYLRAELIDKNNGRVARAWSSPIWLRP